MLLVGVLRNMSMSREERRKKQLELNLYGVGEFGLGDLRSQKWKLFIVSAKCS